MRKKYSACLALLLTGCVSQSAVKPTAVTSTSIVQTINSYYKASEAGLFAPPNPDDIFKGIINEQSDRISFRKWWCLDNRSSDQELYNLVKEHCQKSGGTFKDQWCSSKDEKPLYFVAIGSPSIATDFRPSSPYCSGALGIGVVAEESNTNKDAWYQYAKKIGYVENSVKTQQEAEEAQESNLRNQLILEKRTKEASYMLANRGTKVCQSINSYMKYTGYVEDSNNGKVKINITEAGSKNSQMITTLSDFQPHTVWDNPMNWYVCE